jgi:nucleotidyltransferase/DNA polymerase involved in DNA repair
MSDWRNELKRLTAGIGDRNVKLDVEKKLFENAKRIRYLEDALARARALERPVSCSSHLIKELEERIAHLERKIKELKKEHATELDEVIEEVTSTANQRIATVAMTTQFMLFFNLHVHMMLGGNWDTQLLDSFAVIWFKEQCRLSKDFDHRLFAKAASTVISEVEAEKPDLVNHIYRFAESLRNKMVVRPSKPNADNAPRAATGALAPVLFPVRLIE